MISVVKKQVTVDGRGILDVLLVDIDGEQGLTVPKTAALLGVNDNTIRMMIREHKLRFVSITDEMTPALRIAGVISLSGRRPHFLPQESIQEIVRRLNTPEANAVYSQLWAEAASIRKQPSPMPTPILALAPDSYVLDSLKDDLASSQRMVSILRGALKHRKDNAVHYCLQDSIKSVEAIKLYPLILAEALDYKKFRLSSGFSRNSSLSNLTDAGWVTLYMRDRQDISTSLKETFTVASGEDLTRCRFNRADFERIEDLLKYGQVV